MFQMKFTLHPDAGEPVEVTAGPRDQLAWERAAPNRTTGSIIGQLKMADLYPLAHIAAKRSGAFSGSLAEFEKSVDLEMGHTLTAEESTEVDEVVPTRPAP